MDLRKPSILAKIAPLQNLEGVIKRGLKRD